MLPEQTSGSAFSQISQSLPSNHRLGLSSSSSTRKQTPIYSHYLIAHLSGRSTFLKFGISEPSCRGCKRILALGRCTDLLSEAGYPMLLTVRVVIDGPAKIPTHGECTESVSRSSWRQPQNTCPLTQLHHSTTALFNFANPNFLLFNSKHLHFSSTPLSSAHQNNVYSSSCSPNAARRFRTHCRPEKRTGPVREHTGLLRWKMV
jgi:hypothetical protein